MHCNGGELGAYSVHHCVRETLIVKLSSGMQGEPSP